jgi:chorismate mutase
MSNEQRALAANLLLERVELKRDIALIKADLSKRAEALIKFGGLLRSNPHVVDLDDQPMTPEYVQRAQKFSSEDLDTKRIAALVDELRSKTERLGVAEQQIRGMGYPID